MVTKQELQNLLLSIAQKIPILFETIRKGNHKSEFILDTRRINGQEVRLKLVAEEVEPDDQQS